METARVPSARSLLVAALAVCLVMSGCASGKSVSATVAKSNGNHIAAGLLGGPFTSASVGSAESILARSGIATVANESSTTPLVGVTGSVRMTFTRAQVTSLALGAADGNGTTGSALDATAKMPSGDPSFSYLLAAWVSKVNTPAATEMRTVMGPQDWADAPSIIFPTIALPLFVSDVITASAASHSSATPASRVEPLGGIPPIQLTGFGLCSAVTTFIQQSLNSMFNALMITAPTGTFGTVLELIWDTAVVLAQAVVSGLLTRITSAALSALEVAAGAAGIASEIAAYVTPWTIQVIASPATVQVGDRGTFAAQVTTPLGAASSYPPVVTDCAKAANITLPPLSGAGLAATWSLSGAITATTSSDVTLDNAGATTIGFCAGSSPCGSSAEPSSSASSSCSASAAGGGSSTIPADLGVATLDVTRPDIDGLKTFVDGILDGLSGPAGYAVSVATSVLSSIVGPIDAQVGALDQNVYGTGVVNVGDVATPGPSSSGSGTCTPCLVGTWKTTNISIPAERANGGANVTWTMTDAGHLVIDWTGSSPIVSRYPDYTVSSSFTGSATFSWTLPSDASATSGTSIQRELSGGVNVVTTDTLTNPPTVTRTTSPVQSQAAAGTWTCQDNTMTASSSGSEEVISLTRVG
jgi:hypothetical protein